MGRNPSASQQDALQQQNMKQVAMEKAMLEGQLQ
jgi:hypothetical protein